MTINEDLGQVILKTMESLQEEDLDKRIIILEALKESFVLGFVKGVRHGQYDEIE